jgi:hypothetical protein
VERSDRFLERSGGVEVVMVKDVDVLKPQASQALIEAGDEVLPRA